MSSKSVVDTQQEFANKNVQRSHLPTSTILIIVVEKGIVDILNCKDFKCCKVITKLRKNADGDSRVVIDENGNIYANWDSYKETNKLKCGIMVAPQNGCYTFDEDGKVKLEFSETPAASENPHDGGPTIRETQQDFANDDDSNASSNSIHVLVTNSNDLEEAENAREFTYHPVIRSERNGTFVDEDGNTYKSWEIYKSENKLDDGILVAPTNGRYTLDANGQVKLETWRTSAVKKPNKNISRQSATIHEYHYNMALQSNKNIASDDYSTNCSICVLVTKQTNMYDALNSKKFTTHKVLRIENAITKSHVFIDDDNNEYLSWDLYIKENILPEGIMVAPINGIYSLNKDGNVELEVCLTPACMPKSTQNSNDVTIGSLQQHYATLSG